MRVFIASVVVAVILAVGAAFVLETMQQPVDVAFVGSGAKL
jgi:TPP-dependent pyruvate/acetoin dehydrogenase alpha subunit